MTISTMRELKQDKEIKQDKAAKAGLWWNFCFDSAIWKSF